MKHLIISVILLALCISSKAAETEKDSLAFVNAEWEVTGLERGAAAMYAEIRMFDSQQSISVIKYPARRFRTRLILEIRRIRPVRSLKEKEHMLQ